MSAIPLHAWADTSISASNTWFPVCIYVGSVCVCVCVCFVYVSMYYIHNIYANPMHAGYVCMYMYIFMLSLSTWTYYTPEFIWPVNIYTYCHSHNNWGPWNSFQRFLVPGYYWKTVETPETDPQLLWEWQYVHVCMPISGTVHKDAHIYTHTNKYITCVSFVTYLKMWRAAAYRASSLLVACMITCARVCVCEWVSVCNVTPQHTRLPLC